MRLTDEQIEAKYGPISYYTAVELACHLSGWMLQNKKDDIELLIRQKKTGTALTLKRGQDYRTLFVSGAGASYPLLDVWFTIYTIAEAREYLGDMLK